VVGVVFALGQHDLKRLLAYHSIENVGIIMMGIGTALIGEAQHDTALIVLGMAGALLHVVNHGTFKALLFLAAGSVIHATGTREMERMGGVARVLPYTSAAFLVGAVAICGLPPLNGFVSELLVYLGFFSAIGASEGAAEAVPAMAAPALAMIGALAVACFVKVYGVVFLGAPREAEHAARHEAPASMLYPMAALCAVCAFIGLAPHLIRLPLNNALLGYRNTLPSGALAAQAPLGWVSVLSIALCLLAVLGTWFIARRGRTLPAGSSVTWGCGYLRPTSRMQYSATSFAASLVAWFRWVLTPEQHREEVRGLFPRPTHFVSHVPETTLERIYLPFLEYLYEKSAPVRHLQHGKLNIYIVYTFTTLLVLLALTLR
jgi:NADH:ubiquinone oxidoreductase subunit 5 (subunit L)/multisubunit Na+/H+ antiporter MnhA subunit